MLLLEPGNRALADTLRLRLAPAAKRDPVDLLLADFDGAAFHLHTPAAPDVLHIALRLRCFAQLAALGADVLLAHALGRFLLPAPEPGYDLTLAVPLDDPDLDRERLVHTLADLKRLLMSAPLLRAFEQHAHAAEAKQTTPCELMAIHYRPHESIWVRAQADRVTVVFSTLFHEDTDRVLGRVFLQEFADARRQPSLQNAPQVLHGKEPPLEIRHLPEMAQAAERDDVHFVTFVLFPRHFAEGPPRDAVLAYIPLFRDYLHYHIKCSKAYLHSRMRKRVAGFLKVLNRAKPDAVDAEKKLASGRAFRQSVPVV